MTVRAYRRAREISQENMAKQLGVSVGTYQNWEKEPEKITIANAVKIAKIFGVSMNEIEFKNEEQ